MVPVPKKQDKGVRDVNNFSLTISLTSTVSKVLGLCMVLNNHLSSVAEEEGLIADE